MLLDDLPQDPKRDGWVYHAMFGDLDTIHDWPHRPSEFGLCAPSDDLSMMTAYNLTVAKMRGHENYIQQRDAKRKRK